MNFYFDCDGVLLQFHQGFVQYMAKQGVHVLNPAEPSSYNYAEAGTFAGKHDITSCILAFKATPAFSLLSPYADALLALKAIQAVGGRVTLITSCGNDETTRALRTHNLNLHFAGLYDELHLLPFHARKASLLRELPEGVFVDDDPHQIEAALPLNRHRCWLRHRAYNAHANMARITDLRDVLPSNIMARRA